MQRFLLADVLSICNFLESDDRARDANPTGGIEAKNIWPADSSTNIWFEWADSGTERSVDAWGQLACIRRHLV